MLQGDTSIAAKSKTFSCGDAAAEIAANHHTEIPLIKSSVLRRLSRPIRKEHPA